MVAVGLNSQRSRRERVARLIPVRPASASRVHPRSARNAESRRAMRRSIGREADSTGQGGSLISILADFLNPENLTTHRLLLRGSCWSTGTENARQLRPRRCGGGADGQRIAIVVVERQGIRRQQRIQVNQGDGSLDFASAGDLRAPRRREIRCASPQPKKSVPKRSKARVKSAETSETG